MKSWFTSLYGAVTLSVIALLTELWRAFVDFQISLEILPKALRKTFQRD